jgi:RNA polymerase sigma-70 factor (ECF subfamily)
MSGTLDRDEDLMAEVARGHKPALEELLRRHGGRLLAFLQRLLGDRHRGEEMFQEVFLAVWVKRHRYEYPRRFRPWLYAIALNKCRALFRSRAFADVPAAPTAEPADTGPPPDQGVLADETAVLVGHALAALTPRQRAVVTLRIWEQLPYAEIADLVNCSEATVRSHMHHGLAALRQSLGPYFGKPEPSSLQPEESNHVRGERQRPR